MQLRILVWLILVQTTSTFAQIITFPYSENFDSVVAPNFPIGWSASGFIDTASTPRSLPNCILAKGNKVIKTLTSPVFDFTNRIPEKLIFYEYRSNTAKYFRLEIRTSTDGINFNTLLMQFDSIATISSYKQRVVDLSGFGMQQQPNILFRWQLLDDSTNTSGVLRIDDVTLKVATGFDIGLSAPAVAPVNISRKDSIVLSLVVKNCGLLTSSNFSIRFFSDDNSNGLYEPAEQFSSLSGLSLSINDSLLCTATHSPLKVGEHHFIALVDYSLDENHANDSAHVLVNVGNAKGDVLINEIMYYPIGDEPEWVEFMNTSTDTINLKNWRISDSNISTKSIIAQTDMLIPPGSYGVVAKDIDFASYHSGIPFVMANFSALNNSTPDAVVIYDSRLNTIDSVLYAPTWGGQNGKSLERVDIDQPSTFATNWGTSQDSLGSTPGRINSIARLDYDLSLQRLYQTSSLIGSTDTPVLHAVVQNIGKRSVDSVVINFYTDSNHNGLPESSEFLHSCVSANTIAPLDSVVLSASFPQLDAGQFDIIAAIDSWRDERLRNNQSLLTMKRNFESLSLVINEIMYDPLNNQNEWIELFNRTDRPIDLAHWTFNDRPTTSGDINSFVISSQSIIVKPSEYVVISAESSLVQLLSNSLLTDPSSHIIVLNRPGGFGFNNTGDAVILKDLTGKTIDSVMYQSSWGGQQGKSLERIDVYASSNSTTNWGTSQDSLESSPGRINSIVKLDCDVMIKTLMQTQTFAHGKVIPVLHVDIYNIGRRTVDSLLVSFYSDRNNTTIPHPSELIQTLTTAQSLAAGDSILLSESFPQLASGVTNVLVQVDWWRDERLQNNRASISLKISYEPHSLVMNEIMYDPLNGQNEWFEIFNRSNQPIDLANWNFNDKPTLTGVNSFVISNQSLTVKSGEYTVVAADSTFFQSFPSLTQPDSTIHICVLNHSSGFSFNNDGDAVVLKDLTGHTIDSVAYSPRWHHPDVVDTRGRSLERINPNIDSNDPRNWSTCTNISGGTPGKANSIMTTSVKSTSTISVSPNPFSPDGDGFEDFCIIRYNLPLMTSTLNLRIYDIKGRLIRTVANGELAGPQGEIVWDGTDDNKQRARIGVYVIFLEATDRSSGNVMTAKTVVVVATKL